VLKGGGGGVERLLGKKVGGVGGGLDGFGGRLAKQSITGKSGIVKSRNFTRGQPESGTGNNRNK